MGPGCMITISFEFVEHAAFDAISEAVFAQRREEWLVLPLELYATHWPHRTIQALSLHRILREHHVLL